MLSPRLAVPPGGGVRVAMVCHDGYKAGVVFGDVQLTPLGGDEAA